MTEFPRFVRCQTCGNLYSGVKWCWYCPPQQKVKGMPSAMIGTEPWGPEERRKIVWRDNIAE